VFDKEAAARINKLLEAAGWRFFAEGRAQKAMTCQHET
jgi:hypothetical protein